MPDYYNAAGSAGFDALQAFLTTQQLRKHQALLDSLAQTREERLTASDTADQEIRRETLASIKEDRTSRAEDRATAAEDRRTQMAENKRQKDVTEFQNKVKSFVPGDYITPEMMAEGKRLGVPLPISSTGRVIIPTGKTDVALPNPDAQPGPQETSALPGAQPPEALPLSSVYKGSPEQRQRVIDEERIQALINDPNTREGERHYLKMRLALPKGENPPTAASFYDEEGTEGKSKIRPVYRISRSGQMEQIGEAPQGSHFANEPAPQTADRVWLATEDGLRRRSDLNSQTPLGGSVGLPPTAQERNTQRAYGKAHPIIDAVDELSQKINTGEGLLAKMSGGTERIKAKLNYDDDVAEYMAIVTSFTPLVARAMGHTGVLTEIDVQSARAMFPTPGDSKSLRDRKVTRLRKLMTNIEEVSGPSPASRAVPPTAEASPQSPKSELPSVGGTFQGGKVLRVTPVQ